MDVAHKKKKKKKKKQKSIWPQNTRFEIEKTLHFRIYNRTRTFSINQYTCIIEFKF
jgi:hypothetical protein